jgi:ribonuclease VapC
MVMAGRRGPDSRSEVDALLETFGLRVLPFTEDHAREAVTAFLRYGKGRHAAGLNFGDCMAYAVARVEGAPLLFTGGDFARTDVEAPASRG